MDEIRRLLKQVRADAKLVHESPVGCLADALDAALGLYCDVCDGTGDVVGIGMPQAEYCPKCGGDGFSKSSASEILDAVHDALAPLSQNDEGNE